MKNKRERACITDRCNSILDKIVQIILPYRLVKFLNLRIIKAKYIDLNLWSIIHFAYGIAFFFVWVYFSDNLLLGFAVWFLIHLIWEIGEFLMASKGLYPALFYEEFADIIWDTIISMLGYVLIWVVYAI